MPSTFSVRVIAAAPASRSAHGSTSHSGNSCRLAAMLPET
jgi:hypothetical protein